MSYREKEGRGEEEVVVVTGSGPPD